MKGDLFCCFEPLLDLGKVTTGVLTEPEEDYLNGNDDANHAVFSSGSLHANIPESAKLRFRWNADSGMHDGDPCDSDGWLFGIDDVSITLAAAGDTGSERRSELRRLLGLGGKTSASPYLRLPLLCRNQRHHSWPRLESLV